MSAAVARLLARATGSGGPVGLRPRAPARFESWPATGAAVIEIHDPSPDLDLSTQPPASAAAPPPASRDHAPADARHPMPVAVPRRVEADSVPPLPHRDTATPRPLIARHKGLQSAPVPIDPHNDTGPDTAPAADQQRSAESSASGTRVSIAAAAPATHAESTTVALQPSVSIRSLPAPLLGVAVPGISDPWTQTPSESSHHQVTAAPSAATHADAAPQGPDIQIHIGRIELRSDPPATRSPQRRTQDRHTVSLSDYLRRGSG